MNVVIMTTRGAPDPAAGQSADVYPTSRLPIAAIDNGRLTQVTHPTMNPTAGPNATRA